MTHTERDWPAHIQRVRDAVTAQLRLHSGFKSSMPHREALAARLRLDLQHLDAHAAAEACLLAIRIDWERGKDGTYADVVRLGLRQCKAATAAEVYRARTDELAALLGVAAKGETDAS